jgi:hypothetical protein
MRENVARLRQLLHEATDTVLVSEQERTSRSNFEYFELYSPPVMSVEYSPRSRYMRRISRVAASYGWQSEVARFIDHADAVTLAELSDAQIEALSNWLQQLEDCVQHGLGAPEMPPAV